MFQTSLTVSHLGLYLCEMFILCQVEFVETIRSSETLRRIEYTLKMGYLGVAASHNSTIEPYTDRTTIVPISDPSEEPTIK